MNVLDVIGLSGAVLRGLVTGRRVPLVVSWNITYRCNQRCRYCGVRREEVRDADTARVVDIIERLARLGTRVVVLSGGEPLVRDDIGRIIDACARHRMRVLLKSNGALLPERLGELRRVGEVQISLDGPREVHDRIRGAGSFDKVVEAVGVCRQAGIPVCLTAVLTRHSLPRLPELLDIVERLGVGVYVQPVDRAFTPNHTATADYFPQEDAYRAAVDRLLADKRAGRRSILNSEAGLRHFRRWPRFPAVRCFASRFLCALEPDGSLFVCDMFPGFEAHTVPAGDRFEETLQRLELPHPCPACTSGAMVEVNHAIAGDPRALWGLIERVVRRR